MRPKIADARLYGILDLGYVADVDVTRVAAEMIEGGIDVLQLRGKGRSPEELTKIAADLRRVAAATLLIINDFVTVAVNANADGVHVGQDDVFISSARGMFRDGIIGKSTHSVSQAVAAQGEGADYIGFGPVFPTPTKPDYSPIGLDRIREVHECVSIPIFCIGGIKLENLEQVVAAGAKRVVIVSGILQAKDVTDYVKNAKQMLL